MYNPFGPRAETLVLTQTVANGLRVVFISEFYADSESVNLKSVSGRNDRQINLLAAKLEIFFSKYQLWETLDSSHFFCITII